MFLKIREQTICSIADIVQLNELDIQRATDFPTTLYLIRKIVKEL